MRIRAALDGTDISYAVLIESLSIRQDSREAISTAELTLRDTAAMSARYDIARYDQDRYASAIEIREWQQLAISDQDTGQLLFAGFVLSIGREQESNRIRYKLAASDWGILFERTLVTQTWPANTPDSTIVTDVLAYVPGITAGTIVTQILNLGALEAKDQRIRDVLDQVCELTGSEWSVSYDGKLNYYRIGSVIAPFALSDSPNGTTTVAYQIENYENDFSDAANRVLALGGLGDRARSARRRRTGEPGAVRRTLRNRDRPQHHRRADRRVWARTEVAQRASPKPTITAALYRAGLGARHDGRRDVGRITAYRRVARAALACSSRSPRPTAQRAGGARAQSSNMPHVLGSRPPDLVYRLRRMQRPARPTGRARPRPSRRARSGATISLRAWRPCMSSVTSRRAPSGASIRPMLFSSTRSSQALPADGQRLDGGRADRRYRRPDPNVRLAPGSVTSTFCADGSVVTAKIPAGAITEPQIAASAVTANAIAANAVYAEAIQANAVTAIKIAANAVIAGKIAALAVLAGNIAADAVTAGTIAAGAVQVGDLAAGAVTAGTIAANAITADNIQAGVIDSTKLNTTEIKVGGGGSKPGKINVYDSSGTILVAQIGALDGGQYGGAFKVFAAAGTGYADAKIKCDTSGNLTITNASFTITASGYSIYTTPATFDSSYGSLALVAEGGTDKASHVSRGMVIYASGATVGALVRSPSGNWGELTLSSGGSPKMVISGQTGTVYAIGTIRSDSGFQVGSLAGINPPGGNVQYVKPGGATGLLWFSGGILVGLD